MDEDKRLVTLPEKVKSGSIHMILDLDPVGPKVILYILAVRDCIFAAF